MITCVVVLKSARKQLEKSPMQVQSKFNLWIASVMEIGVEEMRKFVGCHDEGLQGDRKGQRSIRLNNKWRAIYVIKNNDLIEFVEVQEITPHEY